MNKPWQQVKRATQSEKYQMEQMAMDETICSVENFQPIFVDDSPLFFEVERHDGYQLQAYRMDTGEMGDSSYHMLVARCGKCSSLMSVTGADFEYCSECQTFYED